MRVALIELLSDRPIVHPTHLESVNWSDDELVIAVRGYRWWEQAYSDRTISGAIRLVFGGLQEGCIRADEFDFDDDEALDDFEVRRVEDVGWAQPSDWSIYCSGPIPDPFKIYGRLHDLLSDAGSFRRAEEFLNQATQFSRFLEMTRSAGYLLAHGPECVRAVVCDELERQAVPYNVLSTKADTSANFVVTLGGSGFLCMSAECEFEDQRPGRASAG